MEKVVNISNISEARQLFGNFDENLKMVESNFGVKIVSRGERLAIKGSKRSVDKSAKLLEEMLFVIRRGGAIKRDELSYSIRSFKRDSGIDLESIYLDRIEISSRRKFITPKTEGQKRYIDAIRQHDVVFGAGPAGTGKTYLAMAMAVNSLKRQEVSRIILTRPAIEAGESLGYLPGIFSLILFPISLYSWQIIGTIKSSFIIFES